MVFTYCTYDKSIFVKLNSWSVPNSDPCICFKLQLKSVPTVYTNERFKTSMMLITSKYVTSDLFLHLIIVSVWIFTSDLYLLSLWSKCLSESWLIICTYCIFDQSVSLNLHSWFVPILPLIKVFVWNFTSDLFLPLINVYMYLFETSVLICSYLWSLYQCIYRNFP